MIEPGSYEMGSGAPGAASTYSQCSDPANPYDCRARPIPSGPSPAQPTQILGTGWNSGCAAAPQLWGSGGSNAVVNLQGSSNVKIACIEITDHSACIEDHPNVPCSKTAPWGLWARDGIFASGSSSVTLQDVNVHGLANNGIHAGGLSNWTLQRVHIVANGDAGWEGQISGASSNSGTLLFQYVEVAYNGCAESYPSSWRVNGASAISSCWGQNENGYGDGLGSATTGGNWTFQNSWFHHNTQDGLDLLYADGTGMVTVQQTRAEANAGNQLKISGPSLIENTIAIGNCTALQGVGIMSTADLCRAQGQTLALAPFAGQNATVRYSSVTGQGDGLIECDSADATSTFTFQNNLFYGQVSWLPKNGGANTFLFYSNFANPVSYAGNLVWHVRTTCPTGSGGICNTDPQITNGAMTAFDATPTGSSALINAANTAASTVAVDFYGHARPASSGYDIGAIEYQGAASGKASSATIVTATPSPATQGQSVTLSATVSGTAGTPTGTVTFMDGATTLGSGALASGVASFATATLAAGTHAITANYAGDSAYLSSSGSTSLVVSASGKSASTTALTATPNPATVGQSVSLKATVSGSAGTPTGSVTFKDGSTTLGTGTLASGVATFATSSLAAGAHSLSASYAGDGTYLSSSGTTSATVNPAASGATTTTLVASPSSIIVGQNVTLSATVTGAAPTGSFAFTVDGISICGTVAVQGSGNTRTGVCSIATLTAGLHSAAVSYSGNATNNSSAATPVAINVSASGAGGMNIDQEGLTGAWYDPTSGGQGIVLQILHDYTAPGHGVLFGGWFTFNAGNPGGADQQRWYTLQGNVNAADTTGTAILDVFATGSGNFNAPPVVNAYKIGTASMQFSDCANATLVYNFTDGTARVGTIHLVRLDENVMCTPSGTGASTLPGYGLSGGWFAKNTSGQGLVFDINPVEGLVFAAWYTFAPNGAELGGTLAQRWYTLQLNNFVYGVTPIYNVPIYMTTGGVFGIKGSPVVEQVGTASVTFQSCTDATLAFTFTSGPNGYLTGTIPLQRAGFSPTDCQL
ncbi:MAG: Ig-like domain-containing protein [Rudaea sp.]